MIFRKKTGDFKGVKVEESKSTANTPIPQILQDDLANHPCI